MLVGNVQWSTSHVEDEEECLEVTEVGFLFLFID